MPTHLRLRSLRLLSILAGALACTAAAAYAEDATKPAPPITRVSTLASSMQWVGVAVSDPDYYLWCTSPIQGPDGKIHLFCSRWPKRYKMDGWRTHSEIVHYVGDRPEGPFQLRDTALPANPGAPWNNSIHNPAIIKVGDQFVLLYISFDNRPDSPFAVGGSPMFTGMAIAPSLDGPWRVLSPDAPLVAPSTDPAHWSHGTWSLDNPAFLAHGGKFYLYFKGAKQQMSSRYGYAVADNVEGPYRLSDAFCTDNIAYIEDATAFVWDGKFCLLTNDNFGAHTGTAGAGILWRSDTPTDFKLADAEVGFFRTTNYAKHVDQSRATKLYGPEFKFERPGILLLDGKPAYFYGPSGFNLSGGDTTESYVMKINLP